MTVDFIVYWSIPIFVSLILFCNHYVRDCPGALERPLEEELGLSPQDYSVLNAVYFIPNIISPLLAGIFITKLGGVVSSFYLSLIIAAVGHLTFAIGASISSKGTMFIGKALSGSMYEIVDAVMPISYMAPLYKGDFQIVVGFCQVFIRLGSVVNFIVSPVAYAQYGLLTALWIASLIGIFSILLLVMARSLETGFPSVFSKNAIEEIKIDKEYKEYKETDRLLPIPSEQPTYGGLVQIEQEDQENGPTRLSDDQKIINHEELNSSSFSFSFSSCWSGFLELTQFHQFSAQYYLYLLSGSFLYGSIVPFWFYGSKYLQDTLFYDISRADSIMTLPEGMVCLTCFLFGLLVTRYQLSTRTKLMWLGVSLMIMTMSFGGLWYSAALNLSLNRSGNQQLGTEPSSQTFQTPMILSICSVTFLGIGFSGACGLYWGSINEIVEDKYLSQGLGVVSCAVNVLPSIIPPFLTYLNTSYQNPHSTVIVLGAMALIGSLCSFVASSPAFFHGNIVGRCGRRNLYHSLE
jgi:hypothetical protein